MTTILIVEDEPSIAELIAFTLKEAGWSSFVVSNAAAAWDFVQHRAPQLVLLDWMLPDRSGLHLLSRIRADRQLQQLSVIMLTAKSMEEDKIAGLDNGADGKVNTQTVQQPVVGFAVSNAGLMANVSLEGMKISHVER